MHIINVSYVTFNMTYNMTPASPRPSRNVILSYPKTAFLFKKGGKKENHMTRYDNMAGPVRQGLWSVI
jgi:hypothetical protein